jgi:phosphatidylserine/phosphatidylglycerophosphate/cardiolipin synthase-like enzyme
MPAQKVSYNSHFIFSYYFSLTMSKTEVFLEGQRAVIARHLNDAKSYILVAMAYFTDAGLFNMLIKKAQEGIRVQLIVRDEETNVLSEIDYENLNNLNGYFSYDKKIHHKFCVIDGLSVLSGSYNWTNQAANINHEDLTVITDDMDTAYRYSARFFSIKTGLTPFSIKLRDGMKPDNVSEVEFFTQGERHKRRKGEIGSERLNRILRQIEERKKNL